MVLCVGFRGNKVEWRLVEDVWGILGILKGTPDVDLKSDFVYLRAVQYLRCRLHAMPQETQTLSTIMSENVDHG